jgi:hypothetical protein
MATGGVMNGAQAAVNGNNFWTGNTQAFGRSAFAVNNTPTVANPGKITPGPVQGISNVQGPSARLPENLNTNAVKTTTYQVGEYTPNMVNNLPLEGSFQITRPAINGYSSSLIKTDLYHNFPHSFDKNIIQYGTMQIRNIDKSFWFSMPGAVNGTSGVYTIGLNQQGIIYHRCFYLTPPKVY